MNWDPVILYNNIGKKLCNQNKQCVFVELTNGFWSVKRWENSFAQAIRNKAVMQTPDAEIMAEWLTYRGYEPE